MIYCAITDLKNESDVEQKLLAPLILGSDGQGLGYSNSEYCTKETLVMLTIDKGQNKRSYRPDYVLYVKGIPVFVIEAKHPNEKLDDGYREARLYAQELNSKYPSGINPCVKVCATNGKEFLYGNSDESNAMGSFEFSEIFVGNVNFQSFLNFASRSAVITEIGKVITQLRGGRQFHKPVAMMGGEAKREEDIGANDFGIALMNEYQRVFNPQTLEDRSEVVKHAYIASTTIEKHTDPIRKIILATLPPSISDTIQIKNTSKPNEITNKIFVKKRLTNQLLLLIGNVGSGKTTFMDYLREVALSSEIKEHATWVYVDLNPAPTSRENIYNWLMDKIIAQLKDLYKEINLNSLDELKKIYAQDIKEFEEGEGSLLEGNSELYNKALFDLIQKLKSDKVKTSKSYTKYLCGERNKTFILALDNCDKRDKDTQLLMFEVARWAKEEYQAVVFLPMRDVTFDLHRTEPPLDTLVKDMTFRIDPPKLSDVLHRRVTYALSESKGDVSYMTSNGINFKVSKSEQEKYLSCVLDSLYNSTPLAKKIIDGLAGRDIRRGIEIFISFCKSGHITAERLLKMRVTDGKQNLESHIVMMAFLRGEKRFYSDTNSYIKNLFKSDPEDKRPDPFTRLAILYWLEKRKGERGISNVKGYHHVSSLVRDLQMSGHSEDRVYEEISFLLKERCIVSENQIEEIASDLKDEDILKNLNEDCLIRIASAGVLHLELLINLSYIAACSEDVWYENQKTAQDIAARISGKTGAGQFSINTTISNAEDLIQYLIEYRKKYYPDEDHLIENNLAFIDLESTEVMVHESRKKFNNTNDELLNDYPIGTILFGTIESHKVFPGAIVILGKKAKGLIKDGDIQNDIKFSPGMRVNVKIVGFDVLRRKFELQLIN